jgi:hypothetical protein
VIGTAFAVHGLWSARWMTDVDRLTPQTVTTVLFAMGGGLAVGAVSMGMLANALRAKGVPPAALFGGACLAFLLVEIAIIRHAHLLASIIWPSFAVFGAMTVLSYSMLADLFAADMIGRANSALNVLHLGMAFVIQSVIGVVANLWRPDTIGHYPKIAYQAAFAVPIGLQVLALLWFLLAPALMGLLRPAAASPPGVVS